MIVMPSLISVAPREYLTHTTSSHHVVVHKSSVLVRRVLRAQERRLPREGARPVSRTQTSGQTAEYTMIEQSVVAMYTSMSVVG